MSDKALVKRLRRGQTFHCPDCGFGFPVQDPTSAARIEELEKRKDNERILMNRIKGKEAENERLRTALEYIVHYHDAGGEYTITCARIARQALGGSDG